MDNQTSLPKLYTDLADWWPILSRPQDYAEEAEFYKNAIFSAFDVPPKTMLELGCGGGNNASHLKKHFEMTLVDIAPGMLEVSRKLNPGCEQFRGDMRDVRLNRTFDTVFIHDAIGYMATTEDLRKAIKTAHVHCRPGGLALFAPDCVKETFRPATSHGGHDGVNRALRYLSWTWDPDPNDDTYICDMVYMLRDEKGDMRSIHDRHIAGLFAKEQWLELMRMTGFEPEAIPFVHSETQPDATFVFLGRKPEKKSSPP